MFYLYVLNIFVFQWSPDRSSVFGSSAEDGLLNIWDYEKVLRFIHACQILSMSLVCIIDPLTSIFSPVNDNHCRLGRRLSGQQRIQVLRACFFSMLGTGLGLPFSTLIN